MPWRQARRYRDCTQLRIDPAEPGGAAGAGIACHGRVRSILLVSTRPAPEIRTLALDSSSRTSVQLARVILERKYGAVPATSRIRPTSKPC